MPLHGRTTVAWCPEHHRLSLPPPPAHSPFADLRRILVLVLVGWFLVSVLPPRQHFRGGGVGGSAAVVFCFVRRFVFGSFSVFFILFIVVVVVVVCSVVLWSCMLPLFFSLVVFSLFVRLC